MGENTAIDQFYNQQLNEYLKSEEYIYPIVDYKGETLDIAWGDIFQLESSSTTYVFREKESVEFFDWLKNQYKDVLDLLEDFSLDINDLVFAIEDGEFSTDGTMDFLLFLGAKKTEVDYGNFI
ncbi:hypothetical protein GYW21_00270 [Lactobacillus mellis]|nr:hypothetical protein [Bombilactobacillus mellis]